MTGLNEQNRASLLQLLENIDAILLGQATDPVQCEGIQETILKELCNKINKLSETISQADEFMKALSEGRLDVDPPLRNFLISPFKQLHSNLKHLTWQTREITKGNLNQHVDFLGDFSRSFNAMIEALKEKRTIEEQLKRANRLLEHEAMTDALTGVANRLKFNLALEQEMSRAKRHQIPLALVMLDIDHFKSINDNYGHPAGDTVLSELALTISRSVRQEDLFARWGGEEFVILMPHSDIQGAVMLAERLRQMVESHIFPEVDHITCSFGIATLDKEEDTTDLVNQADGALYRAKEAGRNRVEVNPD